MTADHAGQTGGERDLCAVIADRARIGVQIEGLPISAEQLDDLLAHVLDPVREHLARPVPVAGQAAREAAVEAVARWLAGAYGEVPVRNMGPWRSDASDLLADPAVVAALSAAPGQLCDRYETEPDPDSGEPADVHSAAPGQEQSAVRQPADVLSDRELGDALDLWWAQREQAETGQEQGR